MRKGSPSREAVIYRRGSLEQLDRRLRIDNKTIRRMFDTHGHYTIVR
jgi:hypothetical protein